MNSKSYDLSFSEPGFTNNPKTRRHVKGFTSGTRAHDFMETLFRKGLRECSWVTLRYEFIQKFQTNDPRAIDKYLGHPEETVRCAGSSVVRQNRNSGTVAHFMYANQRTVKNKKGLLEELGYMTREGSRYILHHEVFSYSSEQLPLELLIRLPEVNGESKESIDDLRVCIDRAIHQGKGNGETVLEVSPIDVETAERKEEEDIDSTHTNVCSHKLNRNDDKLEEALGHKARREQP